jgi:uncharacterized protein (DUF3820 family)
MVDLDLIIEKASFPFGKYRGKTIAEIPSSYLDWVLGEEWFFKQEKNKFILEAIEKELRMRSRSGYRPQLELDEESDWRSR